MHVFALLLGAERAQQVQRLLYQHLVAVWWQVGTVSRMLEHQAGLGGDRVTLRSMSPPGPCQGSREDFSEEVLSQLRPHDLVVIIGKEGIKEEGQGS